jgi:hypothetical protein
MYFGVWMPKRLEGQPAAPVETFARFQAGFLSSGDFHRASLIFFAFYRFLEIFIDVHGFWMIFMYFGVWMPKRVKGQPVAPIETFARFQAGFLSSADFHRFLSIFMGFMISMDCWVAGLARLACLARLAARFGFLALLEWGLVQRRSDTLDVQEKSADDGKRFYSDGRCLANCSLGSGGGWGSAGPGADAGGFRLIAC